MARYFICFSAFLIQICFCYGQEPGQVPKMKCINKKAMDELFSRITGKVINQTTNRENPEATLGPHAFIWPLRAAPNYYQPGFYYISNYVDLDPNSSGTNSLQDYNCGTRTYDTPPDPPDAPNGYEHSGIDICTAPFPWVMVDNNSVEVIAAEGGWIEARDNDEWSRTCNTGTVNPAVAYGNFIALRHADSSMTFYMHMKEGTLTSKGRGDYVYAGEYLGILASSGNSSGPHLHFEVRNPDGVVLDPFQNGSCNQPTGVGSLWAAEEPYYNKQILAIFTLSDLWTNSTCGPSGGGSEIVPFRNHFNPGEIIYFSASVRDIQSSNSVRVRIIGPNSVEYLDNTYLYPNTFNNMFILPVQTIVAPPIPGTYQMLCTYNGQTKLHLFSVGCLGSQTLSGPRPSNTGVISGGTINSTETISPAANNVQYQAENYIRLNPGFHAERGAEFLARKEACTVGGTRSQ
jgi:murein DD-endopeptidase MepM/ murein hydrolase activator NlpD